MAVSSTKDGKPADAWVVCAKCNNAWHRILPGDKTPYWYCQDEKCELIEGKEVEVQYRDAT